MDTTSKLVDMGEFYLKVTLIRKNNGMSLGEVLGHQPPFQGERKKRCYNCQADGHLRHQYSMHPKGARVPLRALANDSMMGANGARKREARDGEMNQPTSSTKWVQGTNNRGPMLSLPISDTSKTRRNGVPEMRDVLQRAMATITTSAHNPTTNLFFGNGNDEDERWENPMSA
ncbi:unnamed protein product [Gordionus sp. m RMFG-2023]